jgi:hypothetical protein
MLSAVKYIVILLIVVALGGAFWYISNLQANLAIAAENEKKLVEATQKQEDLIASMQADIKSIQEANQELNTRVKAAERDAAALADKFDKRDFGALSYAKPKVAEKLVNRGTANVLRCLELASGAPHTEAELNAQKASEINRECPSIANPNYTPVTP